MVPKPTEETHYPASLLFERHSRWDRRANILESEQPSPNSSYSKNSDACDSVHNGDDQKSHIFSVTGFYPDQTAGKDHFFDNYRMPANTHNTPVSKSGYLSDPGSSNDNNKSSYCPTKFDRHTLDRLKSTAASERKSPIFLFGNSRAKWKPPRPPKPSYLSNIDVSCLHEPENIPPSAEAKSPERWEDKSLLVGDSCQSLHLQSGRITIEAIDQRIFKQAPEERPVKRTRKSRDTGDIVTCRYFPRPLPCRDLELLGAPLNNPDMPFPAPIPTIDKLPLRRDSIRFEWDKATPQARDTKILSSMAVPVTTLKMLPNAVWRLAQEVIPLKNLIDLVVTVLFPGKELAVEGLPMKWDWTSGVVMPTPRNSEHAAHPDLEEALVAASHINSAFFLRVNLKFSHPIIKQIEIIGTIVRYCMSSNIATMVVTLVRTLIRIPVLWVLGILQVRIDIELRRI